MKTTIYSFFTLNDNEVTQSVRQQRVRERVNVFFTPDTETMQAFSKPRANTEQPKTIQDSASRTTGLLNINDDSFEIKNGVLIRYKGKEEHVQIPDGVTKIGESAFDNCQRLTSITIPDSVTYIGKEAFSHCESLTYITSADSVTQIGEKAFCGCKRLKSIIIPSSVTSIDDMAFLECKELTEIVIPDNVKKIGSYAFMGCSSLKAVYIKNDFVIGHQSFPPNSTFFRRPSINPVKGFDIRNAVLLKYTGSSTKANIPSGVKEIADEAFKNSGVTDLIVPEGVTKIQRRLFDGCDSLLTLSLPKNLMDIQEGAFEECVHLSNIQLYPKHRYFRFVDDMLIDIREKTLLFCVQSKTGECLVPDGVNRIGENAFFNCESLTSIAIPKGVNLIESGAFSFCKSLTSITLPNSVVSIGACAFFDCGSLTNITIPDSAGRIELNAFKGCNALKSVYVTDIIQGIDESDIPKNCKLYIRKHNLDNIDFEIENATLKRYRGKAATVRLPDGLQCIGEYAFKECDQMTNIIIPESVQIIEKEAFSFCTGLTEISLPSTVTRIGDSAFLSCENLKTIRNGCGVQFIDKLAFSGCFNLQEMELPEGLISISPYAFLNCISLKNITIPHTVTELAFNAFSGCKNLRRLYLPRHLKIPRAGLPLFCLVSRR